MSYAQLIKENGFDNLDLTRVDNKKILETLDSMETESHEPFIFRSQQKLIVCFLFENVAMSFEIEYSRIILKTYEPNDSYEFPWKYMAIQYGLNALSAFNGTKASLFRALCSNAERRKSL